MELTDEATTAKAETMALLDAMMERIAEQERISEEIRIENERVRLEQSAERKRLADEKAAIEAERKYFADLQAKADEAARIERQKLDEERRAFEAENRARQEAIESAEREAREAIAERERLAQEALDAEIAEHNRQIEEQADRAWQESRELKHAAAKVEIVDALLKYGCPSAKAETLADALTTGMVPHMVYQMEIGQ
jgi:hypothetical protein